MSGCSLSEKAEHPLYSLRALRLMSRAFVPFLIPFFRAYIRYFPLGYGKRAVWLRFILPFLAWRAHRYTARTKFNARVHGDCKELVERYIYYFGVWEPPITDCIRRRLTVGDTFIDVGANIGYFSLLASTLVGDSGKVVSIEASPTIFRVLEHHLETNGVLNARTINYAVLDQESTVSLFRGSAGNSGQTTTRLIVGREFECEVKADRLDRLITAQEVRTARIIKIDVEGAEWAVIAGMVAVLENGRDDLEIIVEVSPESLAVLDRTPQDLFSVFAKHGYQPYLLDTATGDSRYFSQAPSKRLERINNGIGKQADVLFSRRNEEFLPG